MLHFSVAAVTILAATIARWAISHSQAPMRAGSQKTHRHSTFLFCSTARALAPCCCVTTSSVISCKNAGMCVCWHVASRYGCIELSAGCHVYPAVAGRRQRKSSVVGGSATGMIWWVFGVTPAFMRGCCLPRLIPHPSCGLSVHCSAQSFLGEIGTLS